ncbi:endonuclease/exonuclease/phosphatase family protein [Roseateles chitinivorans]|uniref:endonuclease/exonuclease/phosphatase family protein n=1 Tax=Roseateles chitinivorans TaxID=2917965 RepID=UPI003D66ADBA
MKQDQPTDQHKPDPGIRIAWWNTGLSPTRAPDRASEADFRTAAGVLRHLISKTKAQVIVLGEMATTSVALLRRACPIAERLYEWIEAFQSAGKSRFSVCILSRKKRLKVTFEEIITHVRDGRVSRIGQHFIAIPHSGPPIHVIASHWPGRLHLHRSDSFRTHIAAHLREWIDRHLLATDSKENVVLLGDFNDEPFDEGVEHYLKASRDRERVRQVRSLFYNPFWRHMSSFGRENEQGHAYDCGTYFHAGGILTRWRTFDQMIFSSALLFGRSGWRLNEAHTHVVQIPDFKGVVTSSTSFFDHLPIIGHLERSDSNA